MGFVDWFITALSSVPNKPGIYSVKDKKTGTTYVGATSNLRVRLKSHAYSINRKEQNHPMRNSNIEDVEFSVIERVEDTKQLHEKEETWKKKLGAINKTEKNGHYGW